MERRGPSTVFYGSTPINVLLQATTTGYRILPCLNSLRSTDDTKQVLNGGYI